MLTLYFSILPLPYSITGPLFLSVSIKYLWCNILVFCVCRIFTFNKPSSPKKACLLVFSFYFRTALLCRFFIFHYFGCCAQCSRSQKNSHQNCYCLTYKLRVKPSLKCRKKTTIKQRFIEVLLTLDVKCVIIFFSTLWSRQKDKRKKLINFTKVICCWTKTLLEQPWTFLNSPRALILRVFMSQG